MNYATRRARQQQRASATLGALGLVLAGMTALAAVYGIATCPPGWWLPVDQRPQMKSNQ
jgi:hypothetical protein